MMKFRDFLLQDLNEEVTSGDIQPVDTKIGLEKQKSNFYEDEYDYTIDDQLVQITQEIFNASISEIHTYTELLVKEFCTECDVEEGEYYTKENLIQLIIELLEDGIDEEYILDVMGIPDSEFQGSDEEQEDFYELVLSYLNTLFVEVDINEQVTGRFTVKNYNRKKRKFMKNSKSVMDRTKTKRRQAQRQNRAARRQYYRKNKMKIKRYQKQRNKAIQQGKHKVKIRRRV